jgi:hypothetical protein
MSSPVTANNVERMSGEAYMGLRVGSGFIQTSFNMTCLSCLSPRRCLCLKCPLPEKPMPPLQPPRRQPKSFASGNHHLAATIADTVANSKKISNFCRGPASASREATQEHLAFAWLLAASLGHSSFIIHASAFPPARFARPFIIHNSPFCLRPIVALRSFNRLFCILHSAFCLPPGPLRSAIHHS